MFQPISGCKCDVPRPAHPIHRSGNLLVPTAIEAHEQSRDKAQQPAAGLGHRLEGGMHIVEHDHRGAEVLDGGGQREKLCSEAGGGCLDAVGGAAGEALQEML